MGAGIERYLPLAGSTYLWHDDGLVCRSLRLTYSLARAASEGGRLQDSIRLRAGYFGRCNRSRAHDRTQTSPTSFDVRYRANRQRKLAVGETPRFAVGGESGGGGALVASLIESHYYHRRAA